MKLSRGLVQGYTGDGKGKTTAAIGQGIRAYGNGLKVAMIQFLKGGPTGELTTFKELGDNFKVYRFEKQRDFVWNLDEKEVIELKKEIREGFNFAKKLISENQCDILIMDEIMGVLKNKFITAQEVSELIDNKPYNMELILTGRDIPKEILEKCDLVTEMKCVKHYFEKGIPSRKGIEF